MSQLKVNTIRHTGASSDAVTLATDGTCTAKITNPPPGNRNLIINGSCIVAQRSISSTANGYGSVDRFDVKRAGADEAPTHEQVDVAAGTTPYTKGFRKAIKITNGNQTGGAGAADYIFTRMRLEAQDIANSGWNYTSASSYITFSFWVKSSVAQNFYNYIRANDGTSQMYPFETGSLTANTWTKITKTIPGNSNLQFDNNNDTGLSIYLSQFWGTNYSDSGASLNTWAAYNSAARFPDNTSTWYTTNDATFEMTGLQLEVGDVATDFEHRSYADELRRCQRYCFKWTAADHAYSNFATGNVVATSQVYGIFQGLPVPMRTAPTLTTSGNFRVWDPDAGTNAVTPSMSRGHKYTPTIALTVGSGTPFTNGKATECGANNDTSAEFTLSAEL